MTNSDFGYWILFTVRNETEAEDLMLELSYPQLDLTSLSLVEKDSATMMYQTGDSFVFSQRPYLSHNFVFPMSIPKGETKTYLLNADKRNSAVRFPLRLYEEQAFEAKTEKERLYLTVYYVFLLLVVFVATLIGIALKKWVFIWYAVSVFFYALWLFTWQGFSYKYLTSSFPELNRHFLAFCSQMAVVSLLVLIQSYFETKTLMPNFTES